MYDVQMKSTIPPIFTLMITAVFGGFLTGFTATCYAADAFPHALSRVENSNLNDQMQGRLLMEELNCVACHSSSDSLSAASKLAPKLATVGSRINPYYLERFIQSPHTTKPGATMPDVMGHLSANEKKDVAREITHFLLSQRRTEPFHLQAIDTVASEYGEELFHSVGCVACHSPRNEAGEEVLTESSVALGELTPKYNVKSLTSFLKAPHQTRPSGRMPNMRLNDRDAMRIAHYLLRDTVVPGGLRYTLLKGRVWEGFEDNVTKERSGLTPNFDLSKIPQLSNNSAIIYEGYLKIEAAGQYRFHLEMNGGELLLNEAKVVEQEASNRRGVKKVEAEATLKAGWNKLKLTYIHAGKEPKFQLEISGPGIDRGPISANQLSISETEIKPLAAYAIEPELAAKGKGHFKSLGCVNCHNDIKVSDTQSQAEFAPLAKLNPSQGCLSAASGKSPQFGLSDSQVELIRAALPKVEAAKLSPNERIDHTLIKFNCTSCHDRGDLAGVSPERNEYFVGSKHELGNEGRIPPPLTDVGAKLKKEWLAEVLLRGGTQRDYMAATMPQFGEANVGHLVELFDEVDKLEEVGFAKIADLGETKAAGRELIGATGFSCIACHDFNGQKAGGPGALDIIHSTDRLKKDWFYHFMANPAKFRRGTIMPSSWPGGHVFKEDILDGDAKRQIESLWIYLADGRRAKPPVGLSRKSPELRVADEAVIARGRGTAGYRGIGVGYPERISLAFDSEELNLRLLWKGEFANANPGNFSARGSDRISFPAGIPFHRLASLEDNWPYKRKTDYLFPQDHGYKFGGYYLDEKRRPTFMYRYGDVTVEEYFEDQVDSEKRAYFRRTFTFQTDVEQKEFYFRAASADKISQTGKTFQADRLKVTVVSDHGGIIRKGEPQELLIPLELPKGESKLVLEYRW